LTASKATRLGPARSCISKSLSLALIPEQNISCVRSHHLTAFL
jgi:hypothetical protein